MKHTIDLDSRYGVCVIKVSGTHKRPDDSYKLMRIAGDFGRDHGCSSFLFDMRKAQIISGILDAYNTAVDPEKHGFSRNHRIASVYTKITEEDKFMEDVGVNRGALGFRIFDNMQAAFEWLRP